MKLRGTKKIYQFITNRGFYKFYSRNSGLFITENFVDLSIKYVKKIADISFRQLVINSNDFMDSYVHKDEIKKDCEIIEKRIWACHSIKDYYESGALPAFKKYLDFAKKIYAQYRNNFNSDKKILRDYKKFIL